MRWENYIVLILLLIPLTLSSQRFELSLDRDLTISESSCTNLLVGAQVNLVRGFDCEANLLLSDEFSTVSFINTAADSVLFTFTEPGTYVAFCDADPGGIATSSMCFIVSPQPAVAIPTLSQWSIINLAILMLITLLLALKQAGQLTSSVRAAK